MATQQPHIVVPSQDAVKTETFNTLLSRGDVSAELIKAYILKQKVREDAVRNLGTAIREAPENGGLAGVQALSGLYNDRTPLGAKDKDLCLLSALDSAGSSANPIIIKAASDALAGIWSGIKRAEPVEDQELPEPVQIVESKPPKTGKKLFSRFFKSGSSQASVAEPTPVPAPTPKRTLNKFELIQHQEKVLGGFFRIASSQNSSHAVHLLPTFEEDFIKLHADVYHGDNTPQWSIIQTVGQFAMSQDDTVAAPGMESLTRLMNSQRMQNISNEYSGGNEVFFAGCRALGDVASKGRPEHSLAAVRILAQIRVKEELKADLLAGAARRLSDPDVSKAAFEALGDEAARGNDNQFAWKLYDLGSSPLHGKPDVQLMAAAQVVIKEKKIPNPRRFAP